MKLKHRALVPTRRAAAGGLLAVLLGLLYALAFAPYSQHALGFGALLFGLGLMAAADRPVRAAGWGFCFAWGSFALGLEWTVRSMHEFGRLPLALAWTGEALLAAVCALFWAVAAAAAAKCALRGGPARWLALALLLSAAEWLRGAAGIDFGWLTPALATLDAPWGALAPVLGTQGVTLALLLTLAGIGAAAECAWAEWRGRRPSRDDLWGAGALAAVAAVVLGFSQWSAQVEWSQPGPSAALRLIQADLPVVDGWTRPDSPFRLLDAADLMQTPWRAAQEGLPRATLTPEGILSVDALRPGKRLNDAMNRFIEAAQGPVLYNGFRRGDGRTWLNTAFFIDALGERTTTDKRKLVPFGEFVPAGFRWFVDLLGIPLADLSAGAPEQPNQALGGSIRAGLLICYENLDGEVLRSFWKDPEGAPNLFFVTANLGWFSPSIISQHLDMTRFLAAASARPAASVNMNGRSAVVDARGAVVAQAPAGGRAVLELSLKAAAGDPTPYVRWGDVPFLLLWGLMFVIGVMMHFCRKSNERD